MIPGPSLLVKQQPRLGNAVLDGGFEAHDLLVLDPLAANAISDLSGRSRECNWAVDSGGADYGSVRITNVYMKKQGVEKNAGDSYQGQQKRHHFPSLSLS